MEIIDDNVNNLYIIKRRLADLKQLVGGQFEYGVGSFLVQIFTHPVQEQPNTKARVTNCDTVDVVLKEQGKQYYVTVQVGNDPRFKDYKPIQYEGYNYYDLNKMPLINLCELIKYLHRLSNLAIFT